MSTDYKGVDYGMGLSNIDRESGIRYGVISQNAVLEAWAESSEPWYGDESECGECGAMLDISSGFPDECPKCEADLSTNWDYMEAVSYVYTGDGYICESDSQGDIFITKAPYYTHAQFCSPCAPGACHLGNPLETTDSELDNGRLSNNRCYCFGHDWFEDGVAPYPVYAVATGELVQPEPAK